MIPKKLTYCQKLIIFYFLLGLNQIRIAKKLNCSPQFISTQFGNIYKKMPFTASQKMRQDYIQRQEIKQAYLKFRNEFYPQTKLEDNLLFKKCKEDLKNKNGNNMV